MDEEAQGAAPQHQQQDFPAAHHLGGLLQALEDGRHDSVPTPGLARSCYPGHPLLALMGAPEALVAGPVFLRGLAGEEGKQVCSGQRRWALSPSRLLQRRAPKSGVSREAREDQIPASRHQDPISTLLQIT